MKSYAKVQKYLIILLLTMCTTVAFAQFTRQQAIDKVLNEIVVADTGNINVYAAYTLYNYQDIISLNYDTTLLCPYNYNWVFFVDDRPNASWAHPCRYIFMDSGTGNFQIVNEEQFPKCFRDIECDEYEVVSQIYRYPLVALPPNPNPPDNTRSVNENLYAVIIGTEDTEGGTPGNPLPNRFWYNTSLIYNTLIEKGYSDENIYVHYWDGSSDNKPSDLNFDNGENHIDYAASKERILKTFKNLEGSWDNDPDLHALEPTDQLLVYVTGHGNSSNNHSFFSCKQPYQPYEDLYDNELADAIDEMNCAQMIFLFQPCHSGNFATELTNYNGNVACENRIVHTSTSIDLLATAEYYVTGNHYGEFTYYWAAAVRGVYPITVAPWDHSDYNVGSFPFHEYDYETYHPVDHDPDLNNDDFVQMDEAFWYADDWDTWSEGHPDNPEPDGYNYYPPECLEGCDEEPQKENTMSCENLTTIYGLAGTVDEYKEITGNRNYLVGNTLTVDDDLDVYNNANITISGEDARIVVNNGGELYIYDDVTFSDGEIAVDGEIEIGQRATFNNMKLNFNNHDLQTIFNNTTFNQSMLHNYGMSLTLDNSLFNDCFIAYSHCGDVTVINNTTFHKTWLVLENQEEEEDYVAIVDNCTFFNDNNSMVGVDLLNYDKFYIRNNIIEGYYNGIQLQNSGEGASGTHVIFNNEIKNCAISGIHSYNSTASISSNYLHNNSFGVRFFNYSNTALFGNSNATTYTDSQQIRDNYSYEVYASRNSFPWYMRHNVIIDEDNMGNPYDPLVYYDVRESEGSESVTDIRYNCWGNNFDQDEDLYPIDGFMVDPTWCPGGDTIIHEAAETLYLSGIAQYDSSEYINAKSTFEMVVNQYPETKYASAAMKDLFTIEKLITDDYSTLKQYFNTDPVIQADSVLANLSYFLANKCDVKLENWQIAINHYEDIIINSGLPEDSIFAIIDLGYLYFLMDNSGGRAQAAGHLLEHKPNSKEDFTEKRNFLLSLLPFKNDSDNNNLEFDHLEGNHLLQNTPNPFKGVTTIHFQLKEQCEGSIKVISSIGKIVKEIHYSKTAGSHNIELDMSRLPIGIYYYSMVINGKRTDTKKMVVVK